MINKRFNNQLDAFNYAKHNDFKILAIDIRYFDKETNTFRGGKYSTIREMNTQEGHDPPWNCDFVNRLYTGIGQEKFNKRHGHLQLEKIHEPRISH